MVIVKPAVEHQGTLSRVCRPILLDELDRLVVGGDPQTHLLELLNGSDEFMHRKIFCKWKKTQINSSYLFS